MKRDMELVREIMTYVEGQPAGHPIQTVTVNCDDGATVAEHIRLLIDAGLLEGEVIDPTLPAFVITGISWQGHDFLGAVSNDDVWKKILRKAASVGGGLTIDIAIGLGKQYLKDQFGLET